VEQRTQGMPACRGSQLVCVLELHGRPSGLHGGAGVLVDGLRVFPRPPLLLLLQRAGGVDRG
jgi:hypothetical protein